MVVTFFYGQKVSRRTKDSSKRLANVRGYFRREGLFAGGGAFRLACNKGAFRHVREGGGGVWPSAGVWTN